MVYIFVNLLIYSLIIILNLMLLIRKGEKTLVIRIEIFVAHFITIDIIEYN